MKYLLYIVPMWFLICGCGGPSGPTPLQQAGLNLKAEMTKNDVTRLLSNFEVLTDTNVICKLDLATKYFSTNRQSASEVLLIEKHSSETHFFGETLTIYFDAKDNIIAYYYHPPG